MIYSIFRTHKVIALIAIISFLFFIFAFFIARKEVIFADGAGYFSYPYELLLKGNLNYSSNSAQNYFGVIKTEYYNYNKYPIGTGIFLIPAYLVGEVTNRVVGVNDHSIYNKNYQFFVGVFGIFYLVIGLITLKKILREFFKEKTIKLTLVLIVFATNLIVYSTTDASFSHIYSFVAVNFLLLSIINLRKRLSFKNLAVNGLALGLVLLIRPANVIAISLYLLIFLDKNFEFLKIKDVLNITTKRLKQVTTICIFTLLAIFPQIFYWYSITGKIFIYSYLNEGFNFTSPNFIGLILKDDRGLILQPLIIIGFIGILTLKKKYPRIALIISLYLLLNLYLIASWWMPDYGIGFGHRAFTDYLGIISIPIAAIIQAKRNPNQKKLLYLGIGILILINTILAIYYVSN